MNTLCISFQKIKKMKPHVFDVDNIIMACESYNDLSNVFSISKNFTEDNDNKYFTIYATVNGTKKPLYVRFWAEQHSIQEFDDFTINIHKYIKYENDSDSDSDSNSDSNSENTKESRLYRLFEYLDEYFCYEIESRIKKAREGEIDNNNVWSTDHRTKFPLIPDEEYTSDSVINLTIEYNKVYDHKTGNLLHVDKNTINKKIPHNSFVYRILKLNQVCVSNTMVYIPTNIKAISVEPPNYVFDYSDIIG